MILKTDVRPLIRWAGSKRKLIPQLLRYVPVDMDRYIEPFAGSACFYFNLLPKRAVLGDINKELIQTYRVVRDTPTQLSCALMKMPATEDFYYELRAKQPEDLGRVNRAVRFMYLNRYCFNGVFRTNKAGHFNVPRGVRTGSVPNLQEIKAASRALRKATLVCGDFEACLETIGPRDFIYMDPPYAKNKRPGYGEYGYNVFCEDDLERLITALKSIDRSGASFLLSYSYSPRLKAMFSGWVTKTLLVRRHVAGFQRHRYWVREMLVTNVQEQTAEPTSL